MNHPETKRTYTKSQISIYTILYNKYGIADIKSGVNISNGWVLGVCQEGSITVYVNEKPISLNKNTLFSVHPNQMITAQEGSPNLKIKILYLSTGIIQRMFSQANVAPLFNSPLSSEYKQRLISELFPNTNILPQYIYAEEQQCNDILSIFEILSHHLPPDIDSPNQNISMAVGLLIESIIALLLGAAKTAAPTLQNQTRQEEIAHHFITLLIQNPNNIQDIGHYAAQLCISPKYLSWAVRQATKRTAQEWVLQVTLFNAKQLLLESDLTVAQIADRLNFSTASTFIRFFRTRTGLTPKAFRDK